MSTNPNNAVGETGARTNWKQAFFGSEAQLNQWQVMTHRFEVLNVAFVSENQLRANVRFVVVSGKSAFDRRRAKADV